MMPGIIQTTPVSSAINKKIFLKSRVMTTDIDIPEINYYLAGTTSGGKYSYSLGGIRILNPISGVYYDYTDLVTMDSTILGNIKFSITYKTSYVANKMLNINQLIAIDLTAQYGAGNEPTKDQMDHNLNKVWIDTATNTPKRFTAGGWIAY